MLPHQQPTGSRGLVSILKPTSYILHSTSYILSPRSYTLNLRLRLRPNPITYAICLCHLCHVPYALRLRPMRGASAYATSPSIATRTRFQ